MVLVAELLPGWNTLLQTLSDFRPDPGVVGVDGVKGVVGDVGMDKLFCNLLLSPSSATSISLKNVKTITSKTCIFLCIMVKDCS